MSDFTKLNVQSFNFDNAELEAAKKEVLLDEDVQALIQEKNLTKEQIEEGFAWIINYKEDLKPCKNCPGLMKCPKDEQGFRLLLNVVNGAITSEREPCDKYLEEIKIDARYLVNDIPYEYRGRTPQDLGKNDKRSVKFLLANRSLTAAKPILYTYGDEGTGVSFHLSVLAQNYVARGKTIAYIKAPSYLQELGDLFFKHYDEFKERLYDLYRAEVLFIDDFGLETRTALVRDKIYRPLLEARIEKGKLTYLGSRYSPVEISSLYSSQDRNAGVEFANLIRGHSLTANMNI